MITMLINLIIILFAPFLMMGIIKKTKAFWGGRKGASILQPWFDFLKLIKKDLTISKTTSCVFKIAPLIAFGSILFASFFIPLYEGRAILDLQYGIIVFAYTLALGKFASLISAMDTGSSFEGMGASREACFTTIVEPAFFITVASIMAITGNYSLSGLQNVLISSGSYGILIMFFAALILFIMILVEGSRIPVDDPATHLELTMIHEVMILDNSGVDLALYSWTNGIKMLLISLLIANLIIPSSISGIYSLLCYLGVILIISLLIGTVESAMARIRMSHIFEFVFIMSSLALVILSLVSTNIFSGVQ